MWSTGWYYIFITHHTSNLRGPGQRSRYRDSLRAEWSGDQIPVGARFSATVPTGTGPIHPPIQRVPGLLPGVRGPGRGVEHSPHLARG